MSNLATRKSCGSSNIILDSESAGFPKETPGFIHVSPERQILPSVHFIHPLHAESPNERPSVRPMTMLGQGEKVIEQR